MTSAKRVVASSGEKAATPPKHASFISKVGRLVLSAMKPHTGVDEESVTSRPAVPTSSWRSCMPPFSAQDASSVASWPPANWSSATAVSSPVVLSAWAMVAPHANTSVTVLSLPKNDRADSTVWQPMSRNAPPPAVWASQKWAAWGPECASRARMVRSLPMAPAATIWWAFATLGENTELSA